MPDEVGLTEPRTDCNSSRSNGTIDELVNRIEVVRETGWRQGLEELLVGEVCDARAIIGSAVAIRRRLALGIRAGCSGRG
jgi:hypothetical protein